MNRSEIIMFILVLKKIAGFFKISTNRFQVVVVIGWNVETLLELVFLCKGFLIVGKDVLSQREAFHQFGKHPLGVDFVKVSVIFSFSIII